MDDHRTSTTYLRLGAWLTLPVGLLGTVAFGWVVARESPLYLADQTAEATVVEMTSRRDRDRDSWLGPSELVWETEYNFREPDGTERTGRDDLPINATVDRGSVLPVWYTPGENGRSGFVRPAKWW